MARDRKREERDGVRVLIGREERQEYKTKIKEKEPLKECIRIQTGGQDESLSTRVSGKDTSNSSIYMLILQ